jgi:hypothetical protein
MISKNENQKKHNPLPKSLTEQEKLKMFEVEELEGRLETAWNEGCKKHVNDSCDVPPEEY